MSDLVIDSCVVTKWVIPEIDSSRAVDLLREITSTGRRLIVLDLVLAEVTNAIWKRYHRRLTTAEESERLYSSLMAIPCIVEPARPLLERALAIARDHQRSVYDASFVALAERLGLDAITADVPLWNAVRGRFPNIRLLSDLSRNRLEAT